MRILYVTTISLTMNTFFVSHIEMLVKEGNYVDIACNYLDLPLSNIYKKLNCTYHQIDFSRLPLSKNNLIAYKQLKKVVEDGKYDIVHCHTPNASVITRFVCRKFRKKNELQVFYTAHGFHFYKGAPKLNWLVYYPIEKICSCFTDKLITINREDYYLAKKKFYAKEVYYIPGIGIDLSKFDNIQINKRGKRKEIGVSEDCFLVLSVGELNENKNHQVVIKALEKLGDSTIHYAIAGIGDKREYLLRLANELGVSEQLHLLGYRNDIIELYKCADVYVLPSLREGLNVSLMEAMASGLPCIVSKIRGNVDLIEDMGGIRIGVNRIDEVVVALKKMVSDEEKRKDYSIYNYKKVTNFSKEKVLEAVLRLYYD